MRKLLLFFLLFSSLAWLAVPPTTRTMAQEGTTEATLDEESSDVRTLRDWWDLGGWIMYGIGACSILTLALVLERAWTLRRGAVIPTGVLSKLHAHLRKHELSQALSLCGSSNTSIARVLRAGLLHFDQGLARMQDAVETAGAHEATLLRRNLPLLAALANIATMMGLLGTVLGMITSFELIAETGTGDARVVAGGIFQALVTTAAGLMVGIAAISFHSYLRRKVEVLEADLEEVAFRMLEDLSIHREAERDEGTEAAQLTPQEA